MRQRCKEQALDYYGRRGHGDNVFTEESEDDWEDGWEDDSQTDSEDEGPEHRSIQQRLRFNQGFTEQNNCSTHQGPELSPAACRW